MTEEKTEETTSEKPVEEETTEEETSIEAEEASEEKPLSQESPEALKAQRDKLYARLKKAEEKIKRQEVEFKKGTPVEKASGEDEWKSKVEFLLQNRDYSEEEFDHISNVAYRRDVSLTEAAKVEGDYIQYRREKVEQEKKIPDSTSPEFGSVEKKITGDTPKEDIDKILQERFNKTKEEQKSV